MGPWLRLSPTVAVGVSSVFFCSVLLCSPQGHRTSWGKGQAWSQAQITVWRAFG